MTDILDNPFDPFADEVEATLARFGEKIEALNSAFAVVKEENRSLREQLLTRSTPLEPVIDVEGIATRAAELVPAPKDGEPGKDAVVDYGKITEDLRAILAPMVTAEVSKIPAPSVDLDAIATRAATLIPKPKDGEPGADGIPTIEEVEAVVQRAVADIQVRTFADTYQGVYKENVTYTRGLVATWGGSLWMANVETRNKPGDNNKDWTMIVKRGDAARK